MATAKQTDINLIKDRLRQFRFPDEPENHEHRSRRLSDLKELTTALIVRQLYFCKINDLKNAVYQKEFIPLIPNHKLHDLFKVVVPSSTYLVNHLFLYLYLLAALAITICAFVFNQYWLLLTFPIAFLSFSYMSAILGGLKYYGIVLGIIALLSFVNFPVVAVLFSVHLFSMICAHGLRAHRRIAMINMAFSDEEIFWFLFSSETMSLYDSRIKRNLYKGCDLPRPSDYTNAAFKPLNDAIEGIFEEVQRERQIRSEYLIPFQITLINENKEVQGQFYTTFDIIWRSGDLGTDKKYYAKAFAITDEPFSFDRIKSVLPTTEEKKYLSPEGYGDLADTVVNYNYTYDDGTELEIMYFHKWYGLKNEFFKKSKSEDKV